MKFFDTIVLRHIIIQVLLKMCKIFAKLYKLKEILLGNSNQNEKLYLKAYVKINNFYSNLYTKNTIILFVN